ncbi:hypothetical protein RDV89_02750 [Nocardioides zeae]|uniref:FAD-binding FR-type domain-containing protein n=1 Tax=Nocardioides imazamoxiresistens TaxID=3231893 RepID=A0ABU3PRW8_9ACTN|nr:hypothetical protein [Nocardioides zeae]MDT9591968.1 hypothetical protein [Nocardioides zeae]
MTTLSSFTGRLDAALGRLPMYRVVTLALAALGAYALVLLFTGDIGLPGAEAPDAALSLVALLVASVVSNALLGLVFRARPHTESAVITALLLWFVLLPPGDAAQLWWIVGTAVAANASKYLVAVRGRHLVNPAAAGIVLVATLQHFLEPATGGIFNAWWVANSALLWPLVVAGLVVVWRVRRLDLVLVFVVLAATMVVLGRTNSGQPAGDSATYAFQSSPMLFLAFFMLTEPLTLPPRRLQRLGVAALAAIVFAWPNFASIFLVDPQPLWFYGLSAELALVTSGVVAFALGQRGGVRLELTDRRRVAGEVWELTFAPRRPLRFAPGQYLELALPHRRPDLRGVRRTFSIASPHDADTVSVALRVPEPCSSFKRELLVAETGSRLVATSVGGDFVLSGDGPVVLVAGGIGITPFLSQLRSEGRRGAAGRDAVLVYGVPDADEVPYAEELAAAGVPVVLVAPNAPSTPLPTGWRHVEAPFVSAEAVAEAVPDLAARTAYVSGPPAMVTALRGALRGRCRKVRTDVFAGY